VKLFSQTTIPQPSTTRHRQSTVWQTDWRTDGQLALAIRLLRFARWKML